MNTIKETPFYKISVDTEKNRIYLVLRNFWKNLDVAKDYLTDWQKALKLTSRNFTIITDCRDMKTLPTDVMKIHEQAQKLIVAAGLLKVVDILGDSAFTKFQTDMIVSESRMDRIVFKEIAQAEYYLDELEKNIVK